MNQDTVFAVVDLETTGNSIKNNDRIIQFGCTLIQHNQIIDNISFNINAKIPIPPRITQLTGISNADIENAPTWRAVAGKIKRLLSGKVFVAHNVNFDFPFLNHELNRIGMEPLNVQAIDTVTLSQILMPNLPSYRLRDITQYFNIDHYHPHAAISDAHATAQLFLLLIERLNSLPPETLKGILRLQVELPRDTLDLFKIALAHNAHHNKVSAHLQVLNGLIIRKPPVIDRHYHLPVNLKRQDFKWFFDNFSQPFKFQRNLLIEEPLLNEHIITMLRLMLSLSSQRRQQLIVSVANDHLANRLLEQALPLLQQMNSALSFSRFVPFYHLIDLKRFKITLDEPIRSNQIQMLKARILVWLTITRTGDLTELAIEHHPYLDEIRYLRIPKVNDEEQNFWQLQLKMRNNSDVVLTDHHYLYQHYHFKKKPFLLIYNPLRLPSIALKESQTTIGLRRVNTLIRQLRSKVLNSHQLSLDDLLPNSVINLLMNNLAKVDEHVTIIQKAFSKQFLGKHNLHGDTNHYYRLIELDDLKAFQNRYYHEWKKVHQGYQNLMSISETEVATKLSQITLHQRYLFNDYATQLALFKLEIMQFIKMSQTIRSGNANDYFKINVNAPHDINTCQLTSGISELQQRLKNRIYRFFQPVVLSVSVQGSNKEVQYLVKELNLGPNQTMLKTNYGDARPMKTLHYWDGTHFVNDFEKIMRKLTKSFSYHHRKILLIVDSLTLIRSMYHIWTSYNFTNEFNVFAEQVNASDNKLYKNLLNDQEVIGVVSPKMLDCHPELLKSVDLVLFIGIFKENYAKIWLKQNLSLISESSYVGLIDLSLDQQWDYQLNDAVHQWRISNQDYFHFSLGINKFLLNLKKGTAR